jgi:deoxyribodipyrimidine photo-lyase
LDKAEEHEGAKQGSEQGQRGFEKQSLKILLSTTRRFLSSRTMPGLPAPSLNPDRVVVWFRNDLRVHDNECVHLASQLSRAGARVLPVFFLDPREGATSVTRNGHQKLGPFRAKFLLESLADLRASLRALGSDLHVLQEKPEVGLPTLLLGARNGLVVTQSEPASEEAAVDAAVKASIGPHELRQIWGKTLLHVDDLPLSPGLANLPTVFTPFRSIVEAPGRSVKPRSLFPSPAHGQLPLPVDAPAVTPLPRLEHLGFAPAECDAAENPDPRGVLTFRGGETSGLARLKHYLWDSDALATYFDTRNGMLGADYSTKLSPWIAFGCVSPRMIVSECTRYEAERVKNKSTYWMTFELLWHDYLHFAFKRHGRKMFFIGGFADNRWTWRSDPAAFAAWKAGCTGHPFIDANMRELALTGFMSNRGRQNVASFLTQNLGIDWRLGAEYFEATLIDHNVYANWGNWLYMAGITGGRINVFNIQKQSKDYDVDGAYVRHWLPELANVPTEYVHSPWKMPLHVQQTSGCVVGQHYPQPIHLDKVFGPGGAAYSVFQGRGGEGGAGRGETGAGGAGRGRAGAGGAGGAGRGDKRRVQKLKGF